MVPLLMFFLGPQLRHYIPADTPDDWATMADAVWRYIVRPIAVGGMLVGAAYTLFKMRASLTAGLGKAFADLRQTAADQAKLSRTERYMSSKIVFGLIAVMFVLMCFLYIQISGLIWPAILAAVVMLVVGFIFATVSGNLVGFIGSSNNPISGLTLSTLIIAALLMVQPHALDGVVVEKNHRIETERQFFGDRLNVCGFVVPVCLKDGYVIELQKHFGMLLEWRSAPLHRCSSRRLPARRRAGAGPEPASAPPDALLP